MPRPWCPAPRRESPPASSAARTRPRRDSALRRSAACGRAHAASRSPCGRPWLPCGRESHADACAPACWVDRSASRMDLRIARDARHGVRRRTAPLRSRSIARRPGRAKSRGLYGTAIGQVNARLRCNREDAGRLHGRGVGCPRARQMPVKGHRQAGASCICSCSMSFSNHRSARRALRR